MLDKIKRIKFEFFRNRAICDYKIEKSTQNDSYRHNIIYLVPSLKQKSGGDKVLYRQSETINKLGMPGITSQVLHPHNPRFRLDWFDHQVDFKRDLYFNPKKDLVVIPEVWAVPHARSLAKIGVDYVIFVQGGYIMNTPLYQWEISDLNEAYKKAKLILSISDDATENIKHLFPECANKIVRIYYSVDGQKFRPDTDKENIITYMPRRLARHAKLIEFFLKDKLPSDWRLQPIEGLTEDGVAEVLNKSKIFLSLGELEGLGLPPIEAALAGNFVIGYTGQGGKEYWDPVLFTEIENGDIRGFTKAIISRVEGNLSSPFDTIEVDSRCKLFNRYSYEAENDSLRKFISRLLD
jgi:hypothetical protein